MTMPVRLIIERTDEGYTVEAQPIYLDEYEGAGEWLFLDAGTLVVFVRGYLAIDDDNEYEAWKLMNAHKFAKETMDESEEAQP